MSSHSSLGTSSAEGCASSRLLVSLWWVSLPYLGTWSRRRNAEVTLKDLLRDLGNLLGLIPSSTEGAVSASWQESSTLELVRATVFRF